MSDEKTTNLSSITGANLADNDLVMVVDVSDTTMAATGTNKKVTLNEFAQDSTFSSRYKPLASDRWWINANEFVVLAGSPSLGTLNSGATAHERTGVYLFDASTGEAVGAAFAPPPGWTTFTANIYWSNAGAGSGDVVWTVFGLALGDGDSSASASWQGSNVTATAPAQNVVEVTAAGTTFTVSSGKIHRINFRRAAVEAADTLANDAALIGIELVRAS